MIRRFALPVLIAVFASRASGAQTAAAHDQHHVQVHVQAHHDSTAQDSWLYQAHAALHEWFMGTWLGQTMMEHHAAMHGGATTTADSTARQLTASAPAPCSSNGSAAVATKAPAASPAGTKKALCAPVDAGPAALSRAPAAPKR